MWYWLCKIRHKLDVENMKSSLKGQLFDQFQNKVYLNIKIDFEFYMCASILEDLRRGRICVSGYFCGVRYREALCAVDIK